MSTKPTPDLMSAWETVADQLRDWTEFARLAKRDAKTLEDKLSFARLEKALADARCSLRPYVFTFEDMVNMMEGMTT